MRAAGRYRLLERIASGGMADVWRAEVVGPGGVRKEVALKRIRGEHAESSEFVEMFVQEARLAARLSHANVVQVFDFDRVDGRHVIAMELVRGHHLGRVVERCRERGCRLGVPRALFVAAEVATALGYAHRLREEGVPAGVVHRDVSPHNVLVSWEGEVKLADFGIARAMSRAGLTRPGTLKGKLAYMAPEQARGAEVDGRADLYALGVVLWELLAGRRMHALETEAAILDAVVNGPPPSPPSAWNEAVPAELDALVASCLARDPDCRCGSADDLAASLRALLLATARTPEDWALAPLMRRLWPDGPAREPPSSPAPTRVMADEAPPPSAPVAAEPTEETTRTRAVAQRPARPRWPWGAALVLGAAGIAAWGPWRAPGAGGEGAAPRSVQAAPAPSPRPPEPPPGARASPSPSPGGDSNRAARLEAGGAAAGPPPARDAPWASAPLHRLAVPPPSSGDGLLAVNATPWGTLVVDGRRLGDTPREVRLPAGPHRVRVEHPRLGAVEATVDVAAGRRAGWYPRLGR